MNRFPITFSLMVAPVLLLGTSACSSMDQARTRLAEWKEKREEQRMAREVAEAEKEIAEEAETTGQVASTKLEDSIFLDYANPEGALTGGSPTGVSPELPGTELPVILDLASTDAEESPGEGSIFLGDAAGGGVLPTTVDADLVRAWASTISPIMGASLTEPLITAAMTARATPTETAVAAHSAATDSTPLAAAFAGQPAQTTLRAVTSEMEHE